MADEVRFELDKASKTSLFAALKEMDKGANDQLKSEVVSIVGWLATEVQQAASFTNFGGSQTNWGNQARAIATTVKPRKDRMPYIQVGGSKRVTSTGAPAGLIMYGNEFGAKDRRFFANGGARFPMWSGSSPSGRGSSGWWIYPTLRANQPKITNQWKTAIEKYVINPWGRNG
jgi:hypothetical protein